MIPTFNSILKVLTFQKFKMMINLSAFQMFKMILKVSTFQMFQKMLQMFISTSKKEKRWKWTAAWLQTRKLQKSNGEKMFVIFEFYFTTLLIRNIVCFFPFYITVSFAYFQFHSKIWNYDFLTSSSQSTSAWALVRPGSLQVRDCKIMIKTYFSPYLTFQILYWCAKKMFLRI